MHLQGLGLTHDQASRFLLSWAVAWLVVLEVLSDKPATYSVQVIFPAFAIAVAMFIASPAAAEKRALRFFAHPLVPAAIALTLFLLLTPYAVMREWPSAAIVAVSLVIAAFAALAGRVRSLAQWSILAVVTFGLYAATLLGLVLPSIRQIWPAREIARHVDACGGKPVWILGFREPSAAFHARHRQTSSSAFRTADRE